VSIAELPPHDGFEYRDSRADLPEIRQNDAVESKPGKGSASAFRITVAQPFSVARAAVSQA